MKLSEKINLNMETAYVPAAKLKQVQEMMSNWRENNKRIRICSFIAVFTSIFSAMNFVYEEEWDACLINFMVALIFLIAGIMVTKSSRVVYCIPFLGLMIFSVLPVQYVDMTIRTFFMVTVFIPALVASWFSYKALYNYKNVYIPLTKRKGFPNFVFSTADMYANKMYLKNKDEKTVAEKRVEASFNPFNEQRNITDEEVERMNTLRYEELKRHEQDIFEGPYYESKEVKHSADGEEKYEHGFSIFGVDFIIPHNKIEGATKAENRKVMGHWNELKKNMFENEFLWIFLLAACIMVYMWTAPSVAGLLLYIFLAIYVIGTNFVKKDEAKGFPLVLFIYGFAFVPAMFVTPVVLALFTIIKLPGYIRWLCNLPIYRKLSKEPGFPSFVENTADVYGEQMYIIEKQEPNKKLPKLDPIIMNIGYDDNEKQDKGWNAFDYLDKDAENTAYDDFAYMEQVYEARMKAEAREFDENGEKIKPNKDMGRKTNNEY
ncbi:MAG: hypothetical protein E7557_09500 [Ruminococcaceae bacterium]|nr:hypothetical protein [Oscillospiraceae bacterium]